MLADEIKQFFKGEVLTDDKSLEQYSHDASIFEVKPQVVVAPQDAEDLRRLIKFVHDKKTKGENISVTARSAGTDMSGGPLNDSIVVDFTKHLNHFKELGDDYAVTEPGIYYRDFEKETLKKGLILPSYPASRSICAIGGIVSNNSGGEKTLSYGKTEKYVMELKTILSNGDECIFRPLSKPELDEKIKLQNFEGEIYRKLYELIEKNYDEIKKAKPDVSKNSAGYYLWNVWDKKTFDVNKLIVGSQGTLAFVTEVKFKLVKTKAHSRLAVIFLKDLKPLAEIVNAVLKFKPESFESYDDQTLKLAIKFLPDLLRIMKLKNLFTLGWQFLPEFLMILTGGFPKLVLLAEMTGDDEHEIDARLKELRAALQPFKVKVRLTRNEAEGEKYWTIRRESFNLLRHKIKDKHTAPFIDDITVRPEHLPEFLPQLSAILDKYKDKMFSTIAGHAGDGNFHIIPLMDFSDKSAIALIPKIAEEVYSLVLRYHGSITAEHNDGLIRTPYLKQMYGENIVKLFEETKQIFDPLGIFNPRKKVGDTLEYNFSHIRTSF